MFCYDDKARRSGTRCAIEVVGAVWLLVVRKGSLSTALGTLEMPGKAGAFAGVLAPVGAYSGALNHLFKVFIQCKAKNISPDA